MNAKVKPTFDFTENPIVQPHQPYFRDSLTLNVFSEFCAKHLAILLTGMHPPKDDPYYEQARMVNAFQSLFLGGMQIVCDYHIVYQYGVNTDTYHNEEALKTKSEQPF